VAIIIYAAPKKLTPAHQPVKVGRKTLWIRIGRSRKSLINALGDTDMMKGETVCNTIPDSFAS
jgi:hypothetical protein